MVKNYVIVYDITDDKRRTKIFKLLKEFATPVQYSVFEAYLKPKDLISLQYKIKETIKKDEDSVIIYILCEACFKKTVTIGNEVMVYGRGDIIV